MPEPDLSPNLATGSAAWRQPFRNRLKAHLELALLFTARWGVAIVLLAVITRVALTEVVTPPLLRWFVMNLSAVQKQSEDAAKGAQNVGTYLELLIDRGVLPKGQTVNGLPKAEWSRPFALEDKPQPKEPAK